MDKEAEKVHVLMLDQRSYRALEKQCPAPALSNNPDSAAYNLGIQYVLSKLREGFVVGE